MNALMAAILAVEIAAYAPTGETVPNSIQIEINGWELEEMEEEAFEDWLQGVIEGWDEFGNWLDEWLIELFPEESNA